MFGYNFTDRVRKTLQLARLEAERLHHPYIGTEHLLLGMLREGESVAAAVLRECQVELDTLRARVESSVKAGDPQKNIGPDLPYTSHGKRALELAMTEARRLGYEYVGTEHLLLGVLAAPGPLPAVLADAGLTLEKARAAVLRVHPPEALAGAAPITSPGGLVAQSASRRAEARTRLALLLAVIALAVALVALALAVRSAP